ncbi:MAG: VWA domain-containing protein [Bacteroidia bacterium]|nr:VWA domain-containing protein [Bacteroidia bacterium]MDW8348480.1 VWA domain-containing protein [Bacteroidia bacterium]
MENYLNPFLNVESPDNFEQKCLCTLVLDISGSMSGQPIEELNRGLQEFYNTVKEDYVASSRLEVSIITFGSQVVMIQTPSLIDGFTMPTLYANGSTPLVDAVRMAIKQTQHRKEWYKSTGQPYYRPWIVLITDGEPDSDQDMDGLSQEIRKGVDNKNFLFYAVGVQGYNHQKLQHICHPNTPPLPLKELRFSEFFKWLSASITIVTHSKDGDRIQLPSVSGWTQMDI